MALSEVTPSFNLHQMLGGDFDIRRTKARVYTNVENQTLMDTSTGETRIGDETVTIAADGTGTFTTWAPGADGNPVSWQTYLAVDFPRTGARDRQVRVFGPYTITGTSKTVTNKALTSNVATLTTSTAHGLEVGNTITVAGVDSTFNGDYTITAVPSSTTLSYAKTHADVTSAAVIGGTLTSPNVRLTSLEEEQAIPAEYQTTFTEAAQAYLDAQAEIAGIDDSDSAVAALIDNILVGPLTNAALTDSVETQVSEDLADDTSAISEAAATQFVRPWLIDLGAGESVARIVYMNPLDFGAEGDYAGGPFDDTAAFQAAIDAAHDEGGGVVWVPSGRVFRVEQLELKEGVVLEGSGPMVGGISATIKGSRIAQAEGSSVDMIIGTGFTDPGGGKYLLPCGLRNLMLYGNAPQSPSGKSGFASKDSAGNSLYWQHGCFINNVITFGFQEDGLWIPGGSGVQNISHVHGHMNGGYPIRIVGSAADAVQHVHLVDISGDGNTGGAVVRIEGQTADYQTTITGLKSEQVINFLVDPVTTPGGSVVSNQNALHLHNCESRVQVTGLQHIAGAVWSVVGGTVDATAWTVTGGTKTKPGDAILVSNDNNGKRPIVLVETPQIRSQATQTGGSTPVLIKDTTNLGSRTVPNDSPRVIYGGSGAGQMVIREQSPGTFRHVRGIDGEPTVVPSALQSEDVLAAPLQSGFHAYARDAGTHQKSVVFRQAGDGRSMVRHLKDDGTTAFDAISFKGDTTGAMTQWGMRGLLANFVTFTQTYSTADATLNAYTTNAQSSAYTGATDGEAKLTDLNALRVAYENLRASHDDLMQFVNAIVDAFQAHGALK